MPKRNDGNEQDLRVRPDGPSLEGDNPFTGAVPEGVDPCGYEHGEQEDLFEAETPDTTLLYDWQDISDICPAGLSPLQVDRVFIRILKNHFSDPAKISDENLKSYVYSDDRDVSRLRIVMNTTVNSKQRDISPALIVKRGRQRMQRIAINDLGEGGRSDIGRPHYVRFIQGSHRVLCIGSTDGLTESLAFEVFNVMNCLSPNIRLDLPFHDFQVSEMSEVGILSDLGDSLGVAVECIYAYEYGWTLRHISPTLSSGRVIN